MSLPFEEQRQKEARKDSHVLLWPKILGFLHIKNIPNPKIQEMTFTVSLLCDRKKCILLVQYMGLKLDGNLQNVLLL